MTRVASAGLVLLLSAMLELAGPALASSPPSPFPVAASFSLQLVGNRSAADRNDTIGYAIWLNVTGGQLQLSRVNVTVEPDLVLQNRTFASPADCAIIRSNGTFAEWQCSFLRSGRSYRWSLSAIVDANATRGRARLVTAQAVDLGGGASVPRTAAASVWILLDVLSLQVTVTPVSVVHPDDEVQFVVNVTNIIVPGAGNASDEANLTAYNVRITIGISPGLVVGNTTPRSITRTNLTPSEPVIVNITGIVAKNATDSGRVWLNASLLYEDVAGRTIGPSFEEQGLTVQAQPPLGTDPSAALPAVFAFALLAILGAAFAAPVAGERRLVIDEVFLMHRSGILIQHLSRGPGLRKDDDLVASMFVAIQEFVRDSFQTKATLDELAFAGRKAAVLRGTHIVLAALLSRGSPRYLFPQMKAVERALEKAHGVALADWDGRVSGLDQTAPILQVFLRGGYRRFRRWPR